jgi:hypothetical protein
MLGSQPYAIINFKGRPLGRRKFSAFDALSGVANFRKADHCYAYNADPCHQWFLF